MYLHHFIAFYNLLQPSCFPDGDVYMSYTILTTSSWGVTCDTSDT